jgi:hypothetical protein
MPVYFITTQRGTALHGGHVDRDTKACPMCGEQILSVALKCKHCGSMVNGGATPHASSPPISQVGASAGTQALATRINVGRVWLRFALGSVPGVILFVVLGVARFFDGRGRWSRIFDSPGELLIALGVAIAITSVPAGGVFALVLRKFAARALKPTAVAAGLALSAFTFVAFRILFEWALDRAPRNPELVFLVAVLAALGGTLLAVWPLRPGHAPQDADRKTGTAMPLKYKAVVVVFVCAGVGGGIVWRQAHETERGACRHLLAEKARACAAEKSCRDFGPIKICDECPDPESPQQIDACVAEQRRLKELRRLAGMPE